MSRVTSAAIPTDFGAGGAMESLARLMRAAGMQPEINHDSEMWLFCTATLVFLGAPEPNAPRFAGAGGVDAAVAAVMRPSQRCGTLVVSHAVALVSSRHQ
jgi:hypothetical protein